MYFHVRNCSSRLSRRRRRCLRSLGVTSDAIHNNPTVAAVLGGMDRQRAIVAGAGARPVDSNGNPWQGSYITASGNLMADFHANANAEMQGRLQVARLIHMTDDHGVRDMLRFLLARDTMHQNYHDGPTTTAEVPPPTHPDSRLFGTTELPNTVEKLASKAQDLLNRE